MAGSEQRGVYYFHCAAVLARHVWYRSNEEAGVGIISIGILGTTCKKVLFFAFSNFAIGVRRVSDAVPRLHGTMYRGQPVELHDTVRGDANAERDLLESFRSFFSNCTWWGTAVLTDVILAKGW